MVPYSLKRSLRLLSVVLVSRPLLLRLEEMLVCLFGHILMTNATVILVSVSVLVVVEPPV